MKKYDAGIPEGHPSQELRNLYPNDALLRHNGWTIHSRPRNGPNRWCLGNNIYAPDAIVVTEAEALDIVRRTSE